MMTNKQFKWLLAFKAEYRRRAGVAVKDEDDERLLDQYYPYCHPSEAVATEAQKNEVVPERDYLGETDVVVRALHMALESLSATDVPEEWDCRQVIREAIQKIRSERRLGEERA